MEEQAKKLNIIFNKLLTKKDFLHLHAISGLAFLLLGTTLIGCTLLNDINLLDFDRVKFLNSPIFLVAIWIGFINAITALPLMKFAKPFHNSRDLIAKAAMKEVIITTSFSYNLLLIWQFLRFSNFWPLVLPLSDRIAIISLFLLIAKGLFSTYTYLQIELRNNFYLQLIFYITSLSILLTPLTLLPLLISGQGWIERISSLYPLELFLYAKLSFFLLVTSNILNLGISLLNKKIINYKIFSIFTLLPLLSIPLAVFELIKYPDLTTFNYFIGLF